MTQEIGIREVLEQVNARIDSLERSVESIRAELQQLRSEIQELRRDQVTNFRWLVGILLGVLIPMWVTLIIAILIRT